MVQYRLKIIDIVDQAQGTKTYYLEKPEGLTWEPGTHTSMGHIGYDEGETPDKKWFRTMSIMTLPEDGKIGITTRVPGSSSEFKETLFQLHVGDEVILSKLGNRMGFKRVDRPIILLTMGVGITAVRTGIISFIRNPLNIPMVTLLNVDASGDFVFRKELDPLTSHHYRNHWLSSRKGFFEALAHVITDDSIYYVVGSDAFIHDNIKNLRENGIMDEDIMIDKKSEVRMEFFRR